MRPADRDMPAPASEFDVLLAKRANEKANGAARCKYPTKESVRGAFSPSVIDAKVRRLVTDPGVNHANQAMVGSFWSGVVGSRCCGPADRDAGCRETQKPSGATETAKPSTETRARTGEDDAAEFAKLNKNNDGFIDRAEAIMEPKPLGKWADADTNKDGKISNEEFLAFERKEHAGKKQ